MKERIVVFIIGMACGATPFVVGYWLAKIDAHLSIGPMRWDEDEADRECEALSRIAEYMGPNGPSRNVGPRVHGSR